jgi:hypothetical protein
MVVVGLDAPCFCGTFPGGLPQNSSLFVIFKTPSYPLGCTYRVDCGLCDLCIGVRSEVDASTLTRKQCISTGPPKIRPNRRLPESALMTLETSLSAPDQQEQLYTYLCTSTCAMPSVQDHLDMSLERHSTLHAPSLPSL